MTTEENNPKKLPEETPVIDFKENSPIANNEHDLLDDLQKDLNYPSNPEHQEGSNGNKTPKLENEDAIADNKIKDDPFGSKMLNDEDDDIGKNPMNDDGPSIPKADEGEAGYKKLIENRDKTLQQKEYTSDKGRNL